MSLTFAMVFESCADFETTTELADRILLNSVDWLEPDWLEHQRTWLNHASSSALTWTMVKRLAKESNIKTVGHFADEPAASDAHAGRRAILYLMAHFPDLSAIVLVRDQDNQPERLRGLEQARKDLADAIPIVVGLAIVMRECWVISGFIPQDAEESSRLADERRCLGFDPVFRSHELSPGKPDENRSPKRVLCALTAGDADRERHCWRTTPLVTLRERGAENGLADYLDEVRTKLAPLIGYFRPAE